MKPIQFDQANGLARYTVAGLPVPVLRNGAEIVSVWRLSWWERLRLLFTGRVYLRVISPGRDHQPATIQVRNPFKKPRLGTADAGYQPRPTIVSPHAPHGGTGTIPKPGRLVGLN